MCARSTAYIPGKTNRVLRKQHSFTSTLMNASIVALANPPARSPLFSRKKKHQRNGRALFNSITTTGKSSYLAVQEEELRSEERRVGKECRSRWSPYN